MNRLDYPTVSKLCATAGKDADNFLTLAFMLVTELSKGPGESSYHGQGVSSEVLSKEILKTLPPRWKTIFERRLDNLKAQS